MPVGEQVVDSAPAARISWRWIAILLILSHFLLFTGLGLARHWGFMTSLNDLGMFDQAVWGILHGSPFLNTSSPFNVPINWLGWHFNPVLALLAPLYALVEAPEWFIPIQALALALGAWPIFLLARRVTGSERTASLWVMAYLFNPFLMNAAAWDFHPVVLAVPFAALGALAVETRNERLLLGCCLVLLSIQEQMGLMVAGFGALWGCRNASWKYALWLAVLGLAHTFLVLGVVMPALSPSHAHPMLSSGLGQVSRYGWLGHSPLEIMALPITQPLYFVKRVLLDMGGGIYLVALLTTFIFAPLGGTVFLLPGLGELAANLLSANPMPRSPFSYHSVVLVPLLAVAGIHGVRRIASWQRRYSQGQLAGIVLLFSLLTGYLLAPLPFPGTADFWAPASYAAAPDRDLPVLRAALPAGASLSVQANVGAHFSRREAVHLFPFRIDQVDAVVLRLDSPTLKIGQGDPGAMATLAHHLQMEPLVYLDAVEALLANPDYGVSVWQDPWLVFARGAPAGSPSVRAGILAKIVQLRGTWRPAEDRGDRLEKAKW